MLLQSTKLRAEVPVQAAKGDELGLTGASDSLGQATNVTALVSFVSNLLLSASM